MIPFAADRGSEFTSIGFLNSLASTAASMNGTLLVPTRQMTFQSLKEWKTGLSKRFWAAVHPFTSPILVKDVEMSVGYFGSGHPPIRASFPSRVSAPINATATTAGYCSDVAITWMMNSDASALEFQAQTTSPFLF